MCEPWSYLETAPAANAPVNDNPSGMYCPDCRKAGMYHCSEPEWCGGMKLMSAALPKPATSPPAQKGSGGE
jgi:hypothetical protein